MEPGWAQSDSASAKKADIKCGSCGDTGVDLRGKPCGACTLLQKTQVAWRPQLDKADGGGSDAFGLSPEEEKREEVEEEEEDAKPVCRSCGGIGTDFLGQPCSCTLKHSLSERIQVDSPGEALVKCSACGGVNGGTAMKADGTMMGTPCQVCCKVKLKNGHIGIAGSTEMPTVLEFEGHDARLFVWRYKKAWCIKKTKPQTPPDAASAPRLIGNAKIPAPASNGEWTDPELQNWRGVSDFFADACLKQSLPRSRACSPTKGKAPPPAFTEKTEELGRKMQEPQRGWRPAGVASAWGDAGPAWGSWAPAWGKQPMGRSLSLPTLRSKSTGKGKNKKPLVKTRELSSSSKKVPESKKEFRFVAHAMNEDTAKPETPVSLEAAMAARRRNPWKKPKPDLPRAINDLIGKGDILFEPPVNDDCSTMASTMSAPTLSWEDSRSNLRDGSRSLLGDNSVDFLHDSSCDTVRLPDILPKAKSANPTSQATTAASTPPQNESRAAAERRANRELVQASWRLQNKLSPVKVSIGHMLF